MNYRSVTGLKHVYLIVLIAGLAIPCWAGTGDAAVRVIGHPGEAQWLGFLPAVTGAAFCVEVPGFEMKSSSAGMILSLPGQIPRRNPGEPELPAVAAVRGGVPGIKYSVDMQVPLWLEITNVVLVPVSSRALEDVTTNAPTYREERRSLPSIYETDRFWPDAVAVSQEAMMGTGKLIRIECVPFQYNPVRKILRYAHVLEGRLVPSKEAGAK